MKKDPLNLFRLNSGITWLATALATGISIVVFFYQHFETKESINNYQRQEDQFHEQIQKRLDRIENKVDRILFHKPV